MLGQINPQHRDVTVVGGGISGLLAAYRFDQLGYHVTLIEAGPRLGGLIETKETPWGISEAAAHSLLASPPVQDLFSDLGISTVSVSEGARSRYILRGQKLRKMPLLPHEILLALLRAYFVWAPKGKTPEHLSMDEWGKRFLGPIPVEYGLNPFLKGVYAAGPNDICVGAAFPSLVVPRGHSLLSSRLSKWRKSSSKKEKSPKPMVCVQGGMGQLVERLESRLKERLGDRLIIGESVLKLPRAGNLVLSIPSYIAGELLMGEDMDLGVALCQKVKYAPLISVTAFVRKSDISKPISGVGVLFPEKENRNTLGVLFNSSAFSNRVKDDRNVDSFTIMLGGTSRPEQLQLSDTEIKDLVTQELRETLGHSQPPIHFEIFRWHRAIPIYNQALIETWEMAKKGWCKKPGNILFSNYTGQVSIRGMIEELSFQNTGFDTQSLS